MEENKKSYKKLSLILTIATCFVCCTVFAVLCAIGLIPIPVGNGKFYNLEMASAMKQSCRVEDEATLRKLLLINDELDIVVTKDIEIKDTLLVKGTKKLYGDATIYTDISGEFKTMYMMDVQVGASLTWDGPTLDSDGSCDGINVNQKAELHIKSGTIQFVRDAVYSNGTVTMDGGLIQHVSQNGIVAAFRSKVYVNGGILYNGGNKLLNVETNGYAEVNEGATFKASRSDAIFNAGELNVYGGTICDTTGYGINTEGKLNIEYKGGKKDGYIEMHDIGTIAVRMTSSEDCYISDVHAVNVGTNGVYTTDLRSNGKTTVENCIFDTCAINDGAAISVSRKVVIKDVQILNSQGGGVSCRTYGNLKIDGLVLDGTKNAGFSIYDKFEGKNITISNVELYNVVLKDEAEVTFTDCVFGKSRQISVTCAKNSTLNLENVQIEGVEDEGAIGVRCSEGATLNMLGDDNVISGSTAVGVCLLKDATLNMEGGKICDNQGKVTGAGVWLRKEGATFNMHGGTICNNMTSTSSGAVFVADKTTFNMYGGTISGNKAELSGGAIGIQGVMNMSGGVISENSTKTAGGGIVVGNNTKKNIYGTLNMTGGLIKNNVAGTTGGGVSVSGKTVAKISGGTIQNNKADGIGTGISDNGYLTISRNACITGNDVGLVSRDVVMKIAGNSLNKHSSTKPLVVTPHFKTEPNKYVVIECDNDSAAASMVSQYVKSGSQAYTLLQKEDKKNQITVNVNEIVMDLDTTGAETVYVTNFKELKDAVLTTKTKRNIVLGADITMESLLTVPAGTVINIRDDGHTRTLSRAEKHTTLFFETWYGTGLVLEGTSEGKLVLDGKTSGDAILKNVNSLVRVRGTSAFKQVAFKNNGNTEVTISGAFIRNEYGYATVTDCSFTNGIAKYGAAVYSCGDKLTVKDSVFKNNKATERGGAIGIAKTTTVVENTSFKNNVAAGSGGAVYNASNGNLTLKGTNTNAVFEENKVNGTLAKDNYGGGALCVASGNVTITGYIFKDNTATNSNGGAVQLNSSSVVASMKACTFTGNKTVDTDTTDETKHGGGAILSKSKIGITDSTFTGNTASDFGGAICMAYGELNVDACTFDANTSKEGGAIQTAKKAIVTKINDSVFKNNTSTNNGGAICNNSTSEITIADCTFGGKNAGNKAKNNGGAIYHINGAKITLKDNNAEVAALFQNNKAENYGGAICLGSGTLEVTGYEFVENEAKYGGAVRLNGSVVNVATLDSSVFKKNIATEYGGAINNASKYVEEDKAALTILNCTFGGENEGNEAKSNGGAIFSAFSKVDLVGTKKDSEVFRENKTTDDTSGTGGAIYVLSGTVDVSGYRFADNKAANGGAIAVGGTSDGTLLTSDCAFDGNVATSFGGALHMALGILDVDDCIFDGNDAKQGGAINTADAAVTTTVDDSVFTNNVASTYGGAICDFSKKGITITDCQFGELNGNNEAVNGNTATSAGGAIFHTRSATVKLIDTDATIPAIFVGNESASGGAICIGNGKLEVTGYDFVGNNANNGGAVRLNGYDIGATFDGSVFQRNTASENGGAIYTASTKTAENGYGLTTKNCMFGGTDDQGNSLGNSAAGRGGAIHSIGKSNQVISTTFANNMAVYGGAINNEGSKITMTSCHFRSNQSSVTYNKDDKTGRGGGAVNIAANSDATFDGTGKFTSNSANAWGGAIYVTDSKLKISGHTFDQNTASYGGAILVDSVSADEASETEKVTIAASVFTSNSSTNAGGAIFTNRNLEVTTNSRFTENTAANGGAIYSCGDKLTVKDSVFKNNKATERGGAIGITKTTTVVENTSFKNNVAAGSGGAVYNASNGNLTLKGTNTNAVFEENKVNGTLAKDNYGGGAVCAGSGNVTITGYTFKDNTATNSNGGAVQLNSSSVVASMKACTFTGNKTVDTDTADETKYDGGAILSKSKIGIADSTFTGNTASDFGGAICMAYGELDVDDCIFDGNDAKQGGAINTAEAADTTTVDDSVFTNNVASTYGGAICDFSKNGITITDCQFGELNGNNEAVNGNTATSAGGAIFHTRSATVKLIDTDATIPAIFVGNESAIGGAICIGNGKLEVTGYDFVGNNANNGGAVRLNGYDIGATFDGSVFQRNTASENGGAIYTASTMATEGKYALSVSNCTFGGTSTSVDSYALGNKAKQGGAIWHVTGNVKGENCNFISNKASDRGGALYVSGGGTISFENGKFEGNGADVTGGAILKSGKVALTITGMQFIGNTNTLGTIRNASGANPILNGCTLGENQTTHGM